MYHVIVHLSEYQDSWNIQVMGNLDLSLWFPQ